MNQLRSTLLARMAAARSSLAAARSDGDDYLVAVREGELDSLTRLAVANDVDLADPDDDTGGDAEADADADAHQPRVLDLSELGHREIA